MNASSAMFPAIEQTSTFSIHHHALIPGDETQFAAIRAAGVVGIYGPIPNVISREVVSFVDRALSGRPVDDHQGNYQILKDLIDGSRPRHKNRWVVGAYDCAGWDLHGQLARCSVASLLSRERSQNVPVYASNLTLSADNPLLLTHLLTTVARGYKITKWSARRSLINVGSRPSDPMMIIHEIKQILQRTSQHVALDGYTSWDLPSALELCQILADSSHVAWIEDVLPTPDLSAYEAIRIQFPTVPLALGEQFCDVIDLITVVDRGIVSAITPDVVWIGGITPAIVLLDAARKRGIPAYLHGRGYVPALHLAAAFPDTVHAVEHRLRWEPRRQRLLTKPYQPCRGSVLVPEQPGLGIEPVAAGAGSFSSATS